MRTTLLALFLTVSCFGQGYAPPDRSYTATPAFSATGAGTAIDNRSTQTGGNPAVYWALTYWGKSSTISIKLEGAPDVAGVPGSYTALSVAQGSSNPSTVANGGQIYLCCDYYPWIRVNVTTLTGTGAAVNVRVYGWRASAVSPGGSSGPSANVNVAQWGGTATSLGQKAMAASVPIVVASDQSNLPVSQGTASALNAQVFGAAAIGATPSGNPVPSALRDSSGIIIPEYCTTKAAIGSLTSGSNQLVAVSGSTTIRVCEFFWSGDTLSTFKLVTGTGSSCTSPADETGAFSGAGSGLFGVDIAPPNPLVTTAAKTLCVVVSASSTGGGYILYTQR